MTLDTHKMYHQSGVLFINAIYKAHASPNAAVVPKSVVACT